MPNEGLRLKNIFKKFNPFCCAGDVCRRISIGLLIIGLLSWIGLIWNLSNGFLFVSPIAWLIFVAVPVVVYLVVLGILKIIVRNAPRIIKIINGIPRDVRYMLSLNLMWLFLVWMWGYMLSDGYEYLRHGSFYARNELALYLLPSIGSWLGFLLWKWSKSAPK